MALNIPMPDLPGEALMKGLKTGSDLMHNMMLNQYYGGIHPSGDVANAMYVEQLRKQYGDNDPRYLSAKRAHDLILQGRESLIGYRDVLNQTAGARATSPLGKEMNEGQGRGAQDIIDQNRRNRGFGNNNGYAYDSNGNNVVATPEEIEAAANRHDNEIDSNPRTPEEREAYERSINKKTSDADARKRLNFATNLDITRESIDPVALTYYSGPQGSLRWVADSIQAARGMPSPQFVAYTKAATAASLMAKQMRQFYGDSIQPSAVEKLTKMSNPSAWYKDPQVAITEFKELNNILNKETETYRKSATSPIHLNKKGKSESREGKATGGNSVYDMEATIPQLLAINPNYTEENIRATAKKRKTTVDDVINQLFQKHAGGR